jgi:hypothetical protein
MEIVHTVVNIWSGGERGRAATLARVEIPTSRSTVHAIYSKISDNAQDDTFT